MERYERANHKQRVRNGFSLTLAKRTRIIRNTRDSNDGDFDVEIESRNLHVLLSRK